MLDRVRSETQSAEAARTESAKVENMHQLLSGALIEKTSEINRLTEYGLSEKNARINAEARVAHLGSKLERLRKSHQQPSGQAPATPRLQTINQLSQHDQRVKHFQRPMVLKMDKMSPPHQTCIPSTRFRSEKSIVYSACCNTASITCNCLFRYTISPMVPLIVCPIILLRARS